MLSRHLFQLCLLPGNKLRANQAVYVDHHSHFWLVDAHTKGIGGYHHAGFVLLPGFLALILGGAFQSGMIE